jgi:hypothetical protein
MKSLLLYLLLLVVLVMGTSPAQAQRGYRGGRGYYQQPVPRRYYRTPRPYYGPRYYHAAPYRSRYGHQYYRPRPSYGRPGYYRRPGPTVIIRR